MDPSYNCLWCVTLQVEHRNVNPYTGTVHIRVQRTSQRCRFSSPNSSEVRRAPAAHTPFESSRRELSAATFTTSGGQLQGAHGAAEVRPRFPQVAPAERPPCAHCCRSSLYGLDDGLDSLGSSTGLVRACGRAGLAPIGRLPRCILPPPSCIGCVRRLNYLVLRPDLNVDYDAQTRRH